MKTVSGNILPRYLNKRAGFSNEEKDHTISTNTPKADKLLPFLFMATKS